MKLTESGETIRHAALEDPELRYRQRYADLAVNPEVRETFRKRAGVDSRPAASFSTTMVSWKLKLPSCSHSTAALPRNHSSPIIINSNQDLYLRISFELYLKRLLVGNLERVYELGRDFRNEGVSFKHNPEFTQLEFYWAYADYLQVMELTEQMVSFTAQQVHGSTRDQLSGCGVGLHPSLAQVGIASGIDRNLGN